MQNYGQPPGYQRPGSVASFAGQQQTAPQPPAYGGYQSTAPQNQSQWAAPAQNQAPNQQWNQPQQQGAGGYNPVTYGAMPGAQQQTPHAYPPQQHDQPPPPPPKPYGFAGAVQQQQQQQQQPQSQTQGWPQQPHHNTNHTPQQQGGYPVQGGAAQQQPYNSAAPPPPSATPGGSYFPPPAQGGRPGSIYGANQAASFSNAPAAGPPQPSTVMSPNEQQPAYIPPSLTGQGVQAYMPSNTNPMPGVYVPPPPDMPAWQQAQHAPLQGGGKKFRYTKPTVDPSFYAQGYQGVQPMQPLPPQVQYAQSPVGAPHPQQPPGPPPPVNQYAPQQPPPQVLPQQQQQPQAPFGQQAQPQQQQPPYGQLTQQPGQFQQQPTHQPPYNPNLQSQQVQQGGPYGASNISKPYNQWEAPALTGQNIGQNQQNAPVSSGTQQPQWQPGHHQAQDSQASLGGQHYVPAPGQDIQAPRPLGRTDTASSNFFNQPSPQSQPVSPVTNRQSMSFSSGHQSGLGRTGSVSSIALANLHAQREGTPKPPPPKLPTPPPPRDDKSKFSALGSGGPSDWEHFGADAEIDDEEIFAKKDEPAMLDSVELPASQPELPAGPSPPSTHGWPSPSTQPVMSSGRADTYQPTPPPVIATLAERPASQPPQHSFILGDATPAPLSISPKPIQGPRPSSTNQAFEMGDGAWQRPKESTPAQQQAQHQPPPVQQGFVMDDGGWVAKSTLEQARQQTPVQQTHQPPPLTTGFVMGDGSWGTSQRTPTQESNAWESQPHQQHAAELKTKDDALERLRIDAEKEKAEALERLRSDIEKEKTEALERLRVDVEKEKNDLYIAIEKLRADIESAKTHAVEEKTILQEQIEAMNLAAVHTKTNADAAIKEKDLTIERMKEDVEGKEHNIQERDAIIADLRRQLEAEKSKEPVKSTPVPADLIPGIDPWYAGSLERYITMLRGEANEPQIEEKIKTFRSFLKSESGIRGIEFYDAPPPVPKQDSAPPAPPLDALNTQVPGPRRESPDEEDYDYSPGGRPVLKRKATVPLNDNVPIQQMFGSSTQSTTILTPTSSVDEDLNKTPVQSPPEEQPEPQPLYKAYVPPALFSADSAPSSHRQSISDVPVPAPLASKPFEQRPTMPSNTSKHHDEIFFGAQGPDTLNHTSRPTSRDSSTPDVSIPAPLAFASHRSASTAPPSRKDPSEALADLLPTRIAPVAPNHLIEEVKTKVAHLNQDMGNIDDLTKQWDKTAAVTRKNNESARRKRQEENEEINDDAFNNNEISYADLNVLEQEFKQKEGELKAKEDRDDYASYVEAVFDPIYDTLQSDIKALMDLYIEAENILHTSVSGVESLSAENDAPSTLASLTLLQDLHNCILTRQDNVVLAVAERDKRYKKTEIQPLYASGDMVKMRTVEKHFENAEKQAIVRALRDKAGRVGELVGVAEEIVINAVGVEQREIDHIVAAIRDIDDGAGDQEVLSRAQDTLTHLKTSSKSLLSLFNAMEIRHNAAVLDAEIAQAKAEGKDVKILEEEKAKGEKKFMDEFKRRVEVIEQDGDEIEKLVKEKSALSSEEVEKEKRLKAALEEAKRRNGHV